MVADETSPSSNHRRSSPKISCGRERFCVQARELTGRVVAFRQSALPSLLLLLPLPSSNPSPSLLERHVSQVQLVESVSDAGGSRRGSGSRGR